MARLIELEHYGPWTDLQDVPTTPGRVWFESWAGRTSLRVSILEGRETRAKLCVRFEEAGLGRSVGQVSLVPRHAVTREPPTEPKEGER